LRADRAEGTSLAWSDHRKARMNDRPLHETEELELASELLEVNGEDERGRFVSRLIARFSGGESDRRTPARLLMRRLARAARRVLPAAGRLGGTGPGAGPRARAGRVFGVELEGLSPEDQELELARRFVRFVQEAVQQAERAGHRTTPGPAARAGFRRAAQTLAPGLLRRRLPRILSEHDGRWVQRGRHIIVIDGGLGRLPGRRRAAGSRAEE
jgi:hypothetical protein